jgi:hypothetical protein
MFMMVMLMAWISPGQTLAQGSRPASFVPPRPASLAEVFASGANDLVVIGTVDSAATIFRGFAETCGVTGYSWDTYLEIRLRLEQVIFGTAEDSVLRVTILESSDQSVLNHRVLVRAYRSCDDNWRLRGRLCLLNDESVTFPGHGGRTLAARQVDLLTDLATARPNPLRVYGAASAVLLARIHAVHGWTETGASYDIVPLRWIAGTSNLTPTTIVFPRLADCYPNMFMGDSLLVPLPSSWVPGDSLVLSDCPSAMRVKLGFAPGLGRRVDDLEPALMKIGTKLFVRSVQKPVAREK